MYYKLRLNQLHQMINYVKPCKHAKRNGIIEIMCPKNAVSNNKSQEIRMYFCEKIK